MCIDKVLRLLQLVDVGAHDSIAGKGCGDASSFEGCAGVRFVGVVGELVDFWHVNLGICLVGDEVDGGVLLVASAGVFDLVERVSAIRCSVGLLWGLRGLIFMAEILQWVAWYTMI